MLKLVWCKYSIGWFMAQTVNRRVAQAGQTNAETLQVMR
jgi:hypothetical protein